MYSESTPFSLWIMVMVSTGLPAFSLRPQFVLPRAVRSCHCSAQNLPIASVLRAKAKVLAMVTKSYYHSDFSSYFPLIHSFSTLRPPNFSSSTPRILLSMRFPVSATLLPQRATGFPPLCPSDLGSPSNEPFPHLTIESCIPELTIFQLPHPAFLPQ